MSAINSPDDRKAEIDAALEAVRLAAYKRYGATETQQKIATHAELVSALAAVKLLVTDAHDEEPGE